MTGLRAGVGLTLLGAMALAGPAGLRAAERSNPSGAGSQGDRAPRGAPAGPKLGDSPADGAATSPPELTHAEASRLASPRSIDDLKNIEARVEAVTARVLPSVVGIQAGSGQGSGVIVSKDGYVMTAGHVSGEPGRDVVILLSGGRRVRGKSLGTNGRIDSGLIKISDAGDWPAAEIGRSASLAKGQWVLALGHPGGFRRDRPPVLRLGRVLSSGGSSDFIVTDCTLVGGDSGGPLFDLEGKVVGIHSRIGKSNLINMHVPADAFTESWDRLIKGERWGERFAFLTARGPMLGIAGQTADEDSGVVVSALTDGGPAEQAGVHIGDLITHFDTKAVTSMDQLADLISKKKAGDEVEVQVLRAGKSVTLTATLSKRPRE